MSTELYGNHKCVVINTSVMNLPSKDFTFDIVKREGEYDTLEYWRSDHFSYFSSESSVLGYVFNKDLLVFFEDFKVVYQE